MAKVNVSLALGKNTTINLEALNPVQIAQRVDFPTLAQAQLDAIVVKVANINLHKERHRVFDAVQLLFSARINNLY